MAAPVKQLSALIKPTEEEKPCPPLTSFQQASLVSAPVDRNLGKGNGIWQVGVIDPTTGYTQQKEDNNAGWAKPAAGKEPWAAANMMAGQWSNPNTWETKPCAVGKTNC